MHRDAGFSGEQYGHKIRATFRAWIHGGSDTRMKEHAVSEIVGTLTLIGVVVLGIIIVNVVILSQPRAARVPSIEAMITNNSKLITITHQGGDTLHRRPVPESSSTAWTRPATSRTPAVPVPSRRERPFPGTPSRCPNGPS